MIENKSERPEDKIISFPSPIILATINVIKITANDGPTFTNFLVLSGKVLFNIIPVITGIKTTFKVLKNKPIASTSISLADKLLINKGVITIAETVEVAVIATESAKLEFDR